MFLRFYSLKVVFARYVRAIPQELYRVCSIVKQIFDVLRRFLRYFSLMRCFYSSGMKMLKEQALQALEWKRVAKKINILFIINLSQEMCDSTVTYRRLT